MDDVFFQLTKKQFFARPLSQQSSRNKNFIFLKKQRIKPKNRMLQPDNRGFLSYAEIINVSLVTLMFHFDYK